MDCQYHLYLFFLLVTLTATDVIHINAMKFEVINKAKRTDLGSSFQSKITEGYALKAMESAYDLVESKVYKLENPFQKNEIDKITLLVVENEPPSSPKLYGFLITEKYLEQSEFRLIDFNRKIYTAMTRLFLSMDEGNEWHEELKAAIVDFVLLEAGFAQEDWAKPGEGESWYQRSDVTAQFFKYCDSQESEFVAKLIKNMKSYSHFYLKQNVDPLWKPYKEFYGDGGSNV